MEVYVYIPEGAKHISISHPQMQPLENYDFGFQLQSSKTYHLLIFSKLINAPSDFQFVSFSVQPSSATLFVNNEKWDLDKDGNITRLLPYGLYQYRVSDPKYQDYVGQFKLGNEMLSEKVILSLGFGTLCVSSEPSGAIVHIDKKNVGKTPISIKQVSYGEHQVLVLAKDYIPQWDSVTISDSEPRSLSFIFGKEESSLNKTFEVYGVSFKMVKVNAGTVTMDNKGNKRIRLPDFFIGITEVTRELWYAVMEERKIGDMDSLMPISGISWENCQKFIKKLSKLTGQKFRLPKESEWEFAAKGGDRSQGYLYSGSDEIAVVANYLSINPLPVCSFYPNELGIYDMSGNVWEYCADCFLEKSVKICVVRGGGFLDTSESCQISSRKKVDCSKRNGNIGFRLVLEL